MIRINSKHLKIGRELFLVGMAVNGNKLSWAHCNRLNPKHKTAWLEIGKYVDENFKRKRRAK